MEQHAAALNMTLDKSGNQWKVGICVSYDGLEMSEVEAIEEVYFTFFSQLPAKMKVMQPA